MTIRESDTPHNVMTLNARDKFVMLSAIILNVVMLNEMVHSKG
jgi:hypothetical protein